MIFLLPTLKLVAVIVPFEPAVIPLFFINTPSIVTPDVFVFSFIVSTFIVELQVISPVANKSFIEISDDDVIVACFPDNSVVIVVA